MTIYLVSTKLRKAGGDVTYSTLKTAFLKEP